MPGANARRTDLCSEQVSVPGDLSGASAHERQLSGGVAPVGGEERPAGCGRVVGSAATSSGSFAAAAVGDGRGAAHPVAGRAAAQAGSGKDTMRPTAAR